MFDFPCNKSLQYLELSLCQKRHCVRRGRADAGIGHGSTFQYLGRKIDASAEHQAQRIDHHILVGVFRYVAGGPHVDRAQDVVMVVVRRDHDNGYRWKCGAQLSQGIEAVRARQFQVEQDQVEGFLRCCLQRFGNRTDAATADVGV